MVQNLSHLLNPSSVASVGISQPDRFGGMLYQNLKAFNYPGQVFAVNPRYDTIYDQPCYLSIRHLLERPDCALLAGLNRLAPPDLPDVSLSDLRRMLLLNSSIRQLGRKNISQFLRIMPMPVAELLN
jgi:hypothetical protein